LIFARELRAGERCGLPVVRLVRAERGARVVHDAHVEVLDAIAAERDERVALAGFEAPRRAHRAAGVERALVDRAGLREADGRKRIVHGHEARLEPRSAAAARRRRQHHSDPRGPRALRRSTALRHAMGLPMFVVNRPALDPRYAGFLGL
jgi:hypothetical protein